MKHLKGRREDGKFIVQCDKCGKETYPTCQYYVDIGLSQECLECKQINNKYKHPLYKTWLGMRHRCRNPKSENYHLYGGRGIKVIDAWYDDFWTFVNDIYNLIGERPEGHTLDRFPDKDGNYEHGNVRWATAKEQHENRRKFKRKPFNSKTKGYCKTPSGKYRAMIRAYGKTHFLGTYDCPLIAHLSYQDALERKLNNLPIKTNG